MIQVLLATYKGDRYLSEQIASLEAQTERDWHLIRREDGEDGERLGACGSFMRLLEQAPTSEYYAFMDQDDIWRDDKLSVLKQAMQDAERQYGSHTPIVVHSDLEVIDAEGKMLHPSFWASSNIHPEILDSNIHYLAICNSVTGCAMLFNDAARRVSFPVAKYAFMHDMWIALCTLAAGGKVIPVKDTLVQYRQHGHNTLGAVDYHFTLLDWKHKWMLMKRSYYGAHPLVWHNWWHFLYWKMRYFISLHTL